jgi:hypothetical protein
MLTAGQRDQFPRWLRFEVSKSVITVQREFRARFKKDAPHMNNVFLKPCTKHYIMKTYGEVDV